MPGRPLGSWNGNLTTTPVAIYVPARGREIKVAVSVDAYARLGEQPSPPAVATVNGVTTIDAPGAPASGTFTLVVFPWAARPAATAPVAYNATATDIVNALVATGLFAAADISAAGGPLPSAAVTLTWTGVYAGSAPELAVESAVSPGVVRARLTTEPVAAGGYAAIAAGQEIWQAPAQGALAPRYLYLAAVTGSGTYRVSVYE